MDAAQRIDYTGEGLSEGDLAATPYDQASTWLDDAVARSAASGLVEPSELAFATVDASGRPNVRVVLMRFFGPDGPGFVTDTGSIKSRELAANPACAASLTWTPLFRAIRFRGVARAIPSEELAAYFRTRPWGSRISAWASQQSAPSAGRRELEESYAAYARKWPDTGNLEDVPVPATWGGYRVEADEVEFWAGRSNRLHDRLVFSRVGPGGLDVRGAWSVSRRQP